jgi:hypothetical protein
MTDDELELRAEAKPAVNKDMRTRNLLLYGVMAAIGGSHNIS